MLPYSLAFGSKFVQVLADFSVGHLPAGILFVLGSLLFALGTLVRRNLSLRESSTNPHRDQPWFQAVTGEADHGMMQSDRGKGTPEENAKAA